MTSQKDLQEQFAAVMAQIQKLSQQLTNEQETLRSLILRLQEREKTTPQSQRLTDLEKQLAKLEKIINASPAITYQCTASYPYPCNYISRNIEMGTGQLNREGVKAS